MAKFGSNPVSNFRGKDFVYHWQQKPSDANRGSEKLKTIEKLNWVGLKLNMECEEKFKKTWSVCLPQISTVTSLLLPSITTITIS